MAKRIKYRLNKAKRREFEALKKLSGTQEESRQLTYKVKDLEGKLQRSQQQMIEMDRDVKKIAGYTCIKIGKEPRYPGEVIGCSVMIRADELLYGIRGSREVVNVTGLIRQHSMHLAREIENGILGYMRQENLL